MGAEGWEQDLKKDAASTLGRAAGSANRAAARMHANAGQLEPVGEALVCPKCRTEHDTGLYCVHCNVELVGESFVDVIEPRKRRREIGGPWLVGLLLVPVLLLVLMMFLAILLSFNAA